jgi:hypothetical protein
MQQQQQPQQQGAPWGSKAAVPPDAGYYNFVGFPASIDSPAPLPASAYMVPGGGVRPGNNTPLRPAASVNSRIADLHAVCVPDSVGGDARPTAGETAGFREYYYWDAPMPPMAALVQTPPSRPTGQLSWA